MSEYAHSAGAAENKAVETIVAISTPPGRGGIGIVRLSGPGAVEIATPMLRLRHPLAHAQARFAQVLAPQEAAAPDEAVDEAIVTFFAAPNSYTGEDLVEIAAHGSPVVLELLVKQALRHGATLAEPGEFTQRAFLSGRLDLTQAEAVRDLIDAQTLYQVRVAARQLGGALSLRVRPVKQSLAELIALLEAGIDFAEDDIDVAPDGDILLRIETVRDGLSPIAASFAHGRIVHSGLTLAIVGRPNVGKSSLFNRLVERERAIVTAAPGTTRDLVTERVSLGGIPIELVDTAGLREASPFPLDEAESIGIRRSRQAIADADIVLVVLDATAPIGEDEAELLASLKTRQVLIVRNKTDLLPSNVPASHLNEPTNPGAPCLALETWDPQIPTVPPSQERRGARPGMPHASRLGEGWEGTPGSEIQTSALTGEGIAELRHQMLQLVRGTAAEEPVGMITNLRQHQAVTAALESLSVATEAVRQCTPHEMLLLDLYAALRHLDSLTGETTPDDILNLIFSSFCIGK